MNKEDINIGDYVETWDGGIGYGTSVHSDEFEWMIVVPRKNVKFPIKAGVITTGTYDSKVYKRIGLRLFNKPTNMLEPIEPFVDLEINPSVRNKLNELINHINVIQERLNEYDSTRTD